MLSTSQIKNRFHQVEDKRDSLVLEEQRADGCHLLEEVADDDKVKASDLQRLRSMITQKQAMLNNVSYFNRYPKSVRDNIITLVYLVELAFIIYMLFQASTKTQLKQIKQNNIEDDVSSGRASITPVMITLSASITAGLTYYINRFMHSMHKRFRQTIILNVSEAKDLKNFVEREAKKGNYCFTLPSQMKMVHEMEEKIEADPNKYFNDKELGSYRGTSEVYYTDLSKTLDFIEHIDEYSCGDKENVRLLLGPLLHKDVTRIVMDYLNIGDGLEVKAQLDGQINFFKTENGLLKPNRTNTVGAVNNSSLRQTQ